MSWPNSIPGLNAACLRAFGDTVQYQGAGGASDPADITVVWSDGDTQMPPGVRATAWTLESNFNPLPAKGDVITRGSNRYKVVDPQTGPSYQRDGYGGITLYLRQTSHAPDA